MTQTWKLDACQSRERGDYLIYDTRITDYPY